MIKMCNKVLGVPITVRKKGQITIPKDIRELLNINTGDLLYFKRNNSKVILGKVKPNNEYIEEIIEPSKDG